MHSTGDFHGLKTAAPEAAALRYALKLHVWRPRTRLRMIRTLLSLEPIPGQESSAHHTAA